MASTETLGEVESVDSQHSEPAGDMEQQSVPLEESLISASELNVEEAVSEDTRQAEKRPASESIEQEPPSKLACLNGTEPVGGDTTGNGALNDTSQDVPATEEGTETAETSTAIVESTGESTLNATESTGTENEEADQSASEKGKGKGDGNGLSFDIIDEVGQEEEEEFESDTDIEEEEIDAMLDEGLGDTKENKQPNLKREIKAKLVLKGYTKDHFDILPEGWIEVTHNSGMPIYLHKQSRVCTLSKPYFIGSGSTRKHEIPVSAIPCLNYRKMKEKQQKEKEEQEKQVELNQPPKDEQQQSAEENQPPKDEQQQSAKENQPPKDEQQDEKSQGSDAMQQEPSEENAQQPTEASQQEENPSEENSQDFEQQQQQEEEQENKEKKPFPTRQPVRPIGVPVPKAKLEIAKDTQKERSLDCEALRQYCENLFEFETIMVKRYRNWASKRRHLKFFKKHTRPALPSETKLITCSVPETNGKSSSGHSRKEFIMNPSGKSSICILHEYVQHAMRSQPRYVFQELESSSMPYGATVVINDIQYGSGFGSSKKQAKSEAAKAALEVLIPQMKHENPQQESVQDLSLFDEIRVEDVRVNELCSRAGQLSPYQILLECLKRNYGMGDTEVKQEMKSEKNRKNEFTMTVGKHTATVSCKNKRDGKQRAAQAILQSLHPHISSWGSLLRLYGKGSCKTLKEKKEEEQRITELQSKASANRPNFSILNKLKEEMLKLKAKKEAVKSLGKFTPQGIDGPPSPELKVVDL